MNEIWILNKNEIIRRVIKIILNKLTIKFGLFLKRIGKI